MSRYSAAEADLTVSSDVRFVCDFGDVRGEEVVIGSNDVHYRQTNNYRCRCEL